MSFPDASIPAGALRARRACLIAGMLMPFASAVQAAAPERGDRIVLPDMKLLDGSTLTAADWKDRPGVVVLWSVDCAYCVRHNARLDKLHRQVRNAGGDLRIVGIAVDGTAQTVRDYMREKGYGFPVALDTGGLRARLTDRRLVPMTVLIGRDGRLRQVIPGELSEDDMLGLARG